MSEKSISSAFSNFIDALKYLFESKGNKLSLKTSKDIIGEKVDDYIITVAKEENLKYIKGICKIERSKDVIDEISFSAELFFINKDGSIIQKFAKKDISSARFTTEALQVIDKEKFLEFQIDAPGGTVL